MLDDKDRIFTNLYGFHDWRLAGARSLIMNGQKRFKHGKAAVPVRSWRPGAWTTGIEGTRR